MLLLPYILAYTGIGIFLVAACKRVLMWSRLPMHVRWELYPVAHEAKRAHYGGSYLEEFEWWTKPRTNSVAGELKVMIPEILLLVALREHNRRLWRRSFPFHFGLYLIIACTLLMMATPVLGAAVPGFAGGAVAGGLRVLIAAAGAIGLVLGVGGALGLLHQRLTAAPLKGFTSRADLFNLTFFVVALGCALVTWLTVDRDFGRVSAFVGNLATLNPAVPEGTGAEVLLPAASAILLSALLAYIPHTHMSHFIGKYFAYHAVRWNDTPNLPGGREERTIGELLEQPVGWSAPHIQGGGNRTWAEVASDVAAQEDDKR